MFTTNIGLILQFLKGRMPCFSAFVGDPASQQLAEDKKNYLNGLLIEKSLPAKDLKSKDITYSAFSREEKITNQPEKRRKSRKEADNSRQPLGKRVTYISHLSPMKIQKKRKNCFEQLDERGKCSPDENIWLIKSQAHTN